MVKEVRAGAAGIKQWAGSTKSHQKQEKGGEEREEGEEGEEGEKENLVPSSVYGFFRKIFFYYCNNAMRV